MILLHVYTTVDTGLVKGEHWDLTGPRANIQGSQRLSRVSLLHNTSITCRWQVLANINAHYHCDRIIEKKTMRIKSNDTRDTTSQKKPNKYNAHKSRHHGTPSAAYVHVWRCAVAVLNVPITPKNSVVNLHTVSNRSCKIYLLKF